MRVSYAIGCPKNLNIQSGVKVDRLMLEQEGAEETELVMLGQLNVSLFALFSSVPWICDTARDRIQEGL